MKNNQPISLEELKQKVKPIRNINIERKENLSRLNQLAIWITDHVGTMGFFLIIFVWTASWLSWNTLAPKAFQLNANQ